MTHEQLLKQVRNLYLEAREPHFFYNTKHQQIQRCTSHSISSEFEDLLAQYCYELINDESVQIFIDPQITFPDLNLKNLSGKKTFLFRPDIVIVKNNEIVALLDAKTDLGFRKTTYKEMISQTDKNIREIAGQKAIFKRRTNDEVLVFKISNNIKLSYVAASNNYFTRSSFVDYKEINERERVNIFFLSSGGHLNNYKNGAEEVGNGININDCFMDFDNYILDTINNQ